MEKISHASRGLGDVGFRAVTGRKVLSIGPLLPNTHHELLQRWSLGNFATSIGYAEG